VSCLREKIPIVSIDIPEVSQERDPANLREELRASVRKDAGRQSEPTCSEIPGGRAIMTPLIVTYTSLIVVGYFLGWISAWIAGARRVPS
jgi:hypothetical protein